MMRLLHAAAISMLVASAAYAYGIKYDTLYYSEEIAKIRARLHKERDAIAVAKAEWVLLTRPERLQAMVDQHLDMVALSVSQIARLSDLPVRPPKADEIGRKLETLMIEPTATPKDKRSLERLGDAHTPAATRSPAR